MHTYKNDEMGITLNISIGEMEPGQILAGKNIFLTGATGGIGTIIGQKCIKQGATVIAVDRNKEKLSSLKQILGNNCETICFDITDIESFNAIIDKAHTFFGDINCLVNNAGVSLHEGDFMNVTPAHWDVQFEVNLKAPYFLTQAWVKYYRDHNIKNGKIVMMASDTSGMGASLPYGLSKVALSSLTHGLAKKLIVDGIRINAMAPGTTLTPMTLDLTHGEVCRSTTLGKRALFPEEIAELCIFLLSDLSTCVSGNIFGCSEANICFDNVQREQETNP